MDRKVKPQDALKFDGLQSQPMLVQLLDNLPGMAYRCDYLGRRIMRFVSKGSVALISYQPEELINNQRVEFDDLVCREDQAAVAQELEEAKNKGRPYSITYRLTTDSVEELWVLDRGVSLFTTNGIFEGFTGLITNQTEQVKAVELLEQRFADRTRKLSALYDILEVASDPSDLRTTITRSLRRVLKAIQGNIGAIHLFDKSGEVLTMVAQLDLPETAAAQFSKIPVKHDSLTGWVARNNTPLLIPNMGEDSRTRELAQASGLSLYIGVPIVANDLVRGVLTVLSNDVSRYTAKEEMELLSSVGEQLGVVVENSRLLSQAEQLVVLEERNRLARELHDSVTQSLYSVTLFAEAGINLTTAGEHLRAGQLFVDILETGQQALKEMRLLVHKLRPSILEKEGLIRALQHRLKAVEGRAGIRNNLIVEGTINVNPEEEEALFHVAQEALNNALKHSQATEVQVKLVQLTNDCLILSIIDNGQGFDLAAVREGSGLGLISMRERVENLGGMISYQSRAGQGTEVHVRLPADCIGKAR